MTGKRLFLAFLPVVFVFGCRGKLDLAAIEVQRGRWESAAKLYREHLEGNPESALALQSLSAIECYRLSQYEECAQHADRLLALMPIDSQAVATGIYAYTLLAEAATQANDSARALSHLNRIGEIYFDAGFWNYMNENFLRAEKLLRNAVRLRPDSANAYIRLGILFWNRHMEDSSLVWFQRAEKIAPTNEDPLINQMVVYYQRNDLDAAHRVHRRLSVLRKQLYPDSTFETPIDTTRFPSLDYRDEEPTESLPY